MTENWLSFVYLHIYEVIFWSEAIKSFFIYRISQNMNILLSHINFWREFILV